MGLLVALVRCLKKKKKDDSTSLDSVRIGAQADLSHSFDEHKMDIAELGKRFNQSNIDQSDPKKSGGLSQSAAEQKLHTDGPNALEPPKTISNWALFIRQFNNLLWFLMFGAAAMCFATWFYDPSDPINFWVGFFIVIVVFLMCVISYTEEKKGMEVVRAFSTLMPTSCNVFRNGKEEIRNPEDLVVGDIVVVRSGSRVPADIRVISCTSFYLETSSITGEAEPLEYNSNVAKAETTIFECYNVAFNGSFCVDGEGYGIVIRTGPRTVIGQIASLTTGQTERKCRFELEIERFVRIITVMALTMATILFVAGLIIAKGEGVVRLFVTGFLMVVIANVPQGLPATVTTELTIIARRMARKKVFLKKLEKIDSVGATTVIASDKTGTLTKNCMTVTDIWCNNQYLSARPENQGRTTRRRRRGALGPTEWYDAPLSDILNVICICNKAKLEHAEKKKMFREDDELDMTVNSLPATKELSIMGSPSEVALLRYAAGMLPVEEVRESFKTVFEIPFNSIRKWMMVIVRKMNTRYEEDLETGSTEVEFTVMVKGAPEVLIELCSTIAREGEECELNEKRIAEFNEAYENFGDEGCRVIGMACKKFRAPANTVFSQKNENIPMSGWSFLGMSAIMDPPRETTPMAIAACKEAGIKVYMVTGDHKSTATAIARQIGMIDAESRTYSKKGEVQISQSSSSDWAVITGPELPGLTAKQWDTLLLNRYIVFARTTPEHKLLIVTECQRRGEVVTVTGDGVNDSPALKKADVGVAMGIAGSDVAKQAADIILLDDNFASIVAGIEEGRLLFDNLRKTIAYTMTHMWPELVPIMINFFFGFPLGLTPVQILSIDLITDVPPAVSLAYEGPEEDIMSQPPRKVTTHLVTKGLMIYTYIFMSNFISVGGIVAYLYTWWLNGVGPFELAYTSTKHFKHGAENYTMSDGTIIGEERQIFMAAQAASAFHIAVVIAQCWHLWMCLTRRVSIFKHGVNNIVAVFAVIIDVLLIFFFTYTPGVKFIFGSEPPPWQAWMVPMVVGICMWVFNETRKHLIRHNNPIVNPVKW